MTTELTLIGNAGFRIAAGAARIFIDAFYGAIPGVAGKSALDPGRVQRADLLLVTHAHWDHFDAGAVAGVAARTGARVIGPGSVLTALRGRLPDSALIAMTPSARPGAAKLPSLKRAFPAATVTAFATFHGPEHNSYLIELPGCRCFHDGDNEKTRRLEPAALGQLDALMLGPWQGSGWVDCIERLAPRRYFLMHLTEDELAQHAQNRFLPDLCDHVPAGLVVLRPGASFAFD